MATDYFRKTKSLYSATTNSFSTGEGETITPSSVAGLPTDTQMVLTFDRTVSGKLERILGTISGSNFVVASGGRGYDGTTEQSHTSPTVEYIPNAADINAVVTGLLVGHTQLGVHSASLPLTTPKITTSINDSSGNELFKVTATASAVNEFTVANAAASGEPALSATGSDTDISIELTPKGAGRVTSGAVNIPTISSTDTLTNKRITKRVVTTTDDATAVIDVDVTDDYQLSAVANATTFTVTGTPTDGQVLIIRYKDAGVAKGLTFTGFTALGTTIPTTTTAGKWGYVGCKYNLAATTWHVLAVNTEA